MKFITTPKIVVELAGVPVSCVDDLYAFLDNAAARQWRNELSCGGARRLVLDVDVAERAVAWLKAHGVEQEPKAPERDTERCQDPDCELRQWLDSPPPRGPSPIVPIKNGKHVHARPPRDPEIAS